MSKRNALTDADGEVRELTAQDFARFKPAKDVLPLALQETLAIRKRGPQKAPTKMPTTIRLSADVVQFFRGTGTGWQSRLDSVLREYVATQSR
jgi:uncharacterized protein (DUF4415 family)